MPNRSLVLLAHKQGMYPFSRSRKRRSQIAGEKGPAQGQKASTIGHRELADCADLNDTLEAAGFVPIGRARDEPFCAEMRSVALYSFLDGERKRETNTNIALRPPTDPTYHYYRNYATLREIETRLKSIKNIEKITKTMKIVASTRLGKAEKAMTSSRVYHESDIDFFKTAETKAPEGSEKTLIIAITSDKGLCGSIHSQMGKKVKAAVAEYPTADIVSIGDKTKNQVLRSNADKLVLSFNGVGKETPSFNEASLIVDEISKLGDYDKVVVLYNKFVSSVSFEPSAASIFSKESIDASSKLSVFDMEDDETTAVLAKVALTNAVFAGMAEGYASEISARRNAMDNASKNAGDMINKYSILYNRTRQAVITNELVDIITGASSLN